MIHTPRFLFAGRPFAQPGGFARQLRKVTPWLTLLLLGIAMLSMVILPAQPQTGTLNQAATPLTFTSEGQALLFDAEGVAISNGQYALRVNFAGANAVAPQASEIGENSNQEMPELTSVNYPDLWDGIRLT